MGRAMWSIVGLLLASAATVEAAYNAPDDIVVGMTTGSQQYCYVRSGSNLSAVTSLQQIGLSCGAVLKDGNIVWGTTGNNGLVTIRSGVDLSYVAHNYWVSDIVAMAACPDGNVVFATAAGNVYKRSGTDLSYIAESLGYGTDVIMDLAVAPNGNVIIGCNNGAVYVRDSMLQELATEWSFGAVTAVAVQPNGNIVIGNAAGMLWVRGGLLEASQAGAGDATISDIAVQPNGNIVVGNTDGILRIRDGNDISINLAYQSYGSIYRVACQSDGDVVIASNYNNGTLWLADGSSLATKASGSGYYQVTFLGVQVGEPVVPEVPRFTSGWFDNADWAGANPAAVASGGAKFVVLYAGVNTLNEKIRQYMDSAHSLGVRVVLSVKEIVETGDMTAVMARVNAFKSHPALSGWYIMDEPRLSDVPVSYCETAYSQIKPVSNKPVYAAFYGDDLSHNTPYTYRNAYDILMYDHYPFDHGEGQFSDLSGWKSGCDQARDQAQALGKPLHMILQGYGWIPSIGWNKRLPTLREERFMVFYSLFNGVQDIEFFAEDARPQSVASDTDPYPYDGAQWMTDVGKPVMMEINRIGLAVANGAVADGVSDDRADIRANVYRDPVTGQYFLLALNNTTGGETATFTLNLPSSFAYAMPLYEASEPIAIQGNVFSDTFADYEVHTYLLTNDPAPTFNTVVVGNAMGNYSIRSGIDLSWLADSAQAYLSAGTVLPNGNIVLGSTSANGGCVSIRDGKTLEGLVGDWWASTVVAMAACPDGNVVFATAAGNVFKRSGTDLSYIAESLGYVPGSITDLAVAPNGNVIIGCNNGAVYVRDSMLQGLATEWSFGAVTAVAVQPNGNIVIGNTAGMLWVRGGLLEANQVGAGYGSITDIAIQPNGNIVVGNGAGELRVRDGNNISVSLSYDSDYGYIYRLACLSNGDVVVASEGHGGQLHIRDGNDLTVGKAYDTGCGVVTVLAVQPAAPTPTPTPVPIPGDANRNGTVGFEDFAALQNHYGQHVTGDTWSQGDFNDDGQVTFEDFSILQNHYGQSQAGSAAAADTVRAVTGIPCGPVGVVLLTLIGLMAFSPRNRR